MSTHLASHFTSDAALAMSRQQRLRVVVADDMPHLLNAISRILERLGIEVVATANNGIGAVRAAQRLTPDLVILDVNMPWLSGFQAAVHIKRRLPETKVLLMSADDDAEIGLVALDCGADGFTSKRRLATHL